jgi:hypothetical protein
VGEDASTYIVRNVTTLAVYLRGLNRPTNSVICVSHCLIRDTGETYTSNQLGWMSVAAARSGTTSYAYNALDPLIE